MNILGISAYYHDSAACLVTNGKIIAASQEERFTRNKNDESFPIHSIDFVLKVGNITKKQVDYVIFYEKPFLKFERLIETYIQFAPYGYSSFITSFPEWILKKLWMKDEIGSQFDPHTSLCFCRHHDAHAASAFFPSPFSESAFLTVDGVGEWSTTTYGVGKNNLLTYGEELCFPHSLGMLYSALTYYLGFRINSGEYKVMGLAAYGKPIYKKIFYDSLLDVKSDGSFRMNMNYFNFCTGLTMTNSAFHTLFGGPPRNRESELTQRDMDIARSLQEVTEEILLKMIRYVHKQTKQKKLCLAGGVALNCVANGRILREGPFEDIWIQPAAGDAGGSLGSALYTWYQVLGNTRSVKPRTDSMSGSYLGPSYTDSEIQNFLDSHEIPYKKYSRKNLLITTASYIADEKVIGWLQGKMEFGPRALGNRSIIGDARSPNMQKIMNLKIKFRESFRPFAPAVLCEDLENFFDFKHISPYMLFVSTISNQMKLKIQNPNDELFGLEKLYAKRSKIPAVTHVDYSARIQTVHKETNPLFYDLITEFKQQTKYSVIINTSFNVRGEPIVCTPQDAYLCFMRTEIDYLVLGSFILDKKLQKPLSKDINWQHKFLLD